jgi:predicted transcriptional regulator
VEPERLSELQLAVLGVLWNEGEATVARVRDALEPDRDLAPTTVATLLSRLQKRGVVARRTEGRQFVYRAAVSEREVRRSQLSRLMESLFEGDPASLVSHLVREGDIDPEDLERIRERLAREGESDA